MPAVSKAQQKLMAMAYAAKKGTFKGKVPKKVSELAESMDRKTLREFAATKTRDLPQKKEASWADDMFVKGFVDGLIRS